MPASGHERRHARGHQTADAQGMRGEADVVPSPPGPAGGSAARRGGPTAAAGSRPHTGAGSTPVPPGCCGPARPAAPPRRGQPTNRPPIEGRGTPRRHPSLELLAGIIRQPAALADRRILDPGGGADQDRAAESLMGRPGAARPGPRRSNRAGRTARPRFRPHGVGHEAARRREVRLDRGGVAVAGEVQRYQGVVVRPRVTERAPQTPRLGEPVQHDQGAAPHAHVDMEWHER